MIHEEIKKEVNRIKKQSDFDARENLKGFGITIAIFIKQYHEVGTDEYKENYNFMNKELDKISKRARKGLKDYEVELDYKTRKGEIFGWSNACMQERTTKEVEERIRQKTFYNLRTERKIKPIIVRLNIKEKEEVK